MSWMVEGALALFIVVASLAASLGVAVCAVMLVLIINEERKK